MTPRRWCRFSLRTFSVLLTLVGCALGWLGLHVKWIKDRAAARAWVEQGGGYVSEGQLFGTFFTPPPPVRSAPWSLRLLGEKAYLELGLVREPNGRYSEAEMESLFPEAAVMVTSRPIATVGPH